MVSLDAGQQDVGVQRRVKVRQSLRVAALPQTSHHGLLGQHGLLGLTPRVLDGPQLDQLVHRLQLAQGFHLVTSGQYAGRTFSFLGASQATQGHLTTQNQQ